MPNITIANSKKNMKFSYLHVYITLRLQERASNDSRIPWVVSR